MTTWREHERLLAEHFIVVAIRPGLDVAEPAAHLGSNLKSRVVDLRGQAQPSEEALDTPHIFLTDYVYEDVSATRIRQLYAEGCEVGDLMPEVVAKYVAKYGLYSEGKHERNSTA